MRCGIRRGCRDSCDNFGCFARYLLSSRLLHTAQYTIMRSISYLARQVVRSCDHVVSVCVYKEVRYLSLGIFETRSGMFGFTDSAWSSRLLEKSKLKHLGTLIWTSMMAQVFLAALAE